MNEYCTEQSISKQQTPSQHPTELRPFFAALSAACWLKYQSDNNRAKLWKDPPSRYLIGNTISSNLFSLTYNEDGDWAVAARDLPGMQWFASIPWGKCILQTQKNGKHTFSLICPPCDIAPNRSLNFKGGKIAGFSIDFCIPSRLAMLFSEDSCICTGLFEPRKHHKTVGLTFTGPTLPLVKKGLSNRAKEVK